MSLIKRCGVLAVASSFILACDGRSPESQGGGATAPIPPVITPNPPVAVDDTLTINMNSPRNTVDVLSNDTDADGDTLSVTQVGVSAQGGKVRLENGEVIYEPPLNYSGSDSFPYIVSDGGQTDIGVINVTVNAYTPPADSQVRPCEGEAAVRKTDGRPYCFDVLITGHDGKTIGATVFVPADEGVSKPPMLLHAHGFGESRFASLENPNNFMINRVTAQSLLELWHEGYWVVSYDQRGFNASVTWGSTAESANSDPGSACVTGSEVGCIDAMNPEREGRDMVTVVDWMVANLRDGFDVTVAGGNTTFVPPPGGADPLFAEDETDDPILGTIGLSYGGGFQTIGTAVDTVLKPGGRTRDTRVNAMVPVTTWHDFRYSLSPADVPKSGWLQFLTGAANTGGTAPGPTSFLGTAATQAFVNDDVVAATYSEMYQRSLRSYCEGMGDNVQDGTLVAGAGMVPGAANSSDAGPDVFVIQGQRDLLFNYNEALDMGLCYQAQNPGSDVRVLIQTEGHVLATAQAPSYKGPTEVIYIDETVYCGGAALSTRELISGWFREKLGVIDNTVSPLNADQMPTMCTTHFEPNAAPVDGVTFNSLTDVPIGGSVTVNLDGDSATAGDQDVTFAVTAGSPFGVPGPNGVTPPPPVFEQEVYLASGDVDYSGIPTLTADIAVTGTPSPPVVPGTPTLIDPPRFFVGIAVQRQGAGDILLIADQVAPIEGERVFFPATTSNYTYPRTDAKGFDHGETVGRLVGGSVKLAAGDKLFLQIYTQFPVYNLHGTLTGAYNVTMSNGILSLPILP